MSLAFLKYQGLGNDFVVVEGEGASTITEAIARELCDRHFGIGADGVLLVLPPTRSAAHARMRVINADGSAAEMCGNGLRCVAEHVGRKSGEHAVVIETDSGLYACQRKGEGVEVDMGVVKTSRPTKLTVENRAFDVLEVDMGNPHAVIFDDALGREAGVWGPRIERASAFPRGVNVEFVRDVGASLDVVVWERGAGLTLACGTGACAVARAAVDRGTRSVDTDISVGLPGGALSIRIDAKGRITMTGPAVRVFEGTR